MPRNRFYPKPPRMKKVFAPLLEQRCDRLIDAARDRACGSYNARTGDGCAFFFRSNHCKWGWERRIERGYWNGQRFRIHADREHDATPAG